MTNTLYGPQQSRFASFIQAREERRPDPGFRGLRRRVLSGLRGRVIEVGAGDGRSFEHYPPEVDAVLAVEPNPTAREAARERAEAASIPIEIVDDDAARLPAEDASFDAAVVMGVLCSVPDPQVALRELRRVLAPGGELRCLEHVRSSKRLFRLVQRAVDRLFWTRALGGCETTRDTESQITAAGFRPDWPGMPSLSPSCLAPIALPMTTARTTKAIHPKVALFQCAALHRPARAATLSLMESFLSLV